MKGGGGVGEEENGGNVANFRRRYRRTLNVDVVDLRRNRLCVCYVSGIRNFVKKCES